MQGETTVYPNACSEVVVAANLTDPEPGDNPQVPPGKAPDRTLRTQNCMTVNILIGVHRVSATGAGIDTGWFTGCPCLVRLGAHVCLNRNIRKGINEPSERGRDLTRL